MDLGDLVSTLMNLGDPTERIPRSTALAEVSGRLCCPLCNTQLASETL